MWVKSMTVRWLSGLFDEGVEGFIPCRPPCRPRKQYFYCIQNGRNKGKPEPLPIDFLTYSGTGDNLIAYKMPISEAT